MDLDKLYQKTILEYAAMKEHNHEIDNSTAVERGHNPSCGDDLTLIIKLKDDKVLDAAYIGKGCAISTASTNMMIEAIKGQSVAKTKLILKAFFDMMANKELSDEQYDLLGDAEILGFAANMPARIKCVTLSWHSLKVIFQDMKE